MLGRGGYSSRTATEWYRAYAKKIIRRRPARRPLLGSDESHRSRKPSRSAHREGARARVRPRSLARDSYQGFLPRSHKLRANAPGVQKAISSMVNEWRVWTALLAGEVG